MADNIDKIRAAVEKINSEKEDEKELNFDKDIEQLTHAQQKWIEEE